MKTFLIIFLILSSIALAVPRSEDSEEDLGAKKHDLYINPVGLLTGLLDVGMDFGISEKITLGPRLAFLGRTYNGVRYTGGAVGGHVDFYLGHRRFTNGWVVAPFVDLISFKASKDVYETGSIGGSDIGAAGGYAWFWPGGFNILLAGTVGVFTFPGTFTLGDQQGNTALVNSPYNGGFVGIDFNIGYVF